MAGLRAFGRSVKRLRLPDDIGDDHPGDGVRPLGTMPDLHVIPGLWHPADGYSSLLRWLEQDFTPRSRQPNDPPNTPANLVEFGYDWRLSCRYNAHRLKERVNEAVTIRRTLADTDPAAHLPDLAMSLNNLAARLIV